MANYIKNDGTLTKLDIPVADAPLYMQRNWLKYDLPSRFNAKGTEEIIQTLEEVRRIETERILKVL